MSRQSSANPFAEQAMIQDAARFVGRRAEVAQVLNLLRGMQGVSLVGARRIGKSSLLYHIFQTGQAQLGEGTEVAWTDFRGVTDERSFYECLCKAVGRTGDKLGDLEDAVRDRRVVFCFDQFERVVRSAAFSKAFFDTLRSLAQADHLALLIATEQPLSELCLSDEIASSIFFGIFRPLWLGLFTRAEAVEFIQQGFADAGLAVTENETARLLQLAGRFPAYLALACFLLVEWKAGRAPEWERAFRREAEPHLDSLWSHLKPSERAALRHVLDNGGLAEEEAAEDLARRGLIEPWQDAQGRRGWRLFSEAFEEFAAQPPTMPWRDRLTRLRLPWLESVEVSLWPPSIKIQGKRLAEQSRAKSKGG